MIAPIDQLAEALGVRNCYSGREWLLRLLVPPPERRPQLPDAVQRRLRPFADACAGALGVDDRRRWRDWLTAMCVRTLRVRRRQRSPVRVPVAILRFALAVIAWPLQRFEALLDGIDFAPVTAQLERWSVGSLLSRPFSGAVAMIFGFGLVVLWATTPLSFAQQSAVFLVMWVLTLVVRRIPGHVPTLIMMGFSVLATARYVWWRVTQTLVLESGADYAFGLGLVVAESYAWLILVLGFIQNAWPLDRPTVALPEDSTTWPVVDVYIPSYNEPLKVVKPTVLAALSLDWPRDKLRVHLLDDGRRDSFRSFAREVGANYIQRNDNAHAKAGNLNHAMKVTDAEFIAIFDCDHIPVRSFLQTTVGWFLKDRKCALVQTPHHFFSPDPFERNLDTFGRVPNEGSLFYGLVQDGNDLWNASFFCGSCAVLRRTALAQVGGIAVETVTEDAHTALKMHRLGWTSA